MADFNWSWPTKIERDVIERALTLDFLPEARNLILVGTNGLGKTMIAQNICHQAVLAGHSVLFRSAAALLEELHRHGPEGRHRKLRTYANVGLLCVDKCEVARNVELKREQRGAHGLAVGPTPHLSGLKAIRASRGSCDLYPTGYEPCGRPALPWLWPGASFRDRPSRSDSSWSGSHAPASG
jgi:hypothetical protein